MLHKHRYRIDIEYDGSNYSGWQTQKDCVSIQAVLEEAIYKLTSERVILFAAGRTDAGVHAINQVAHFELLVDWKLQNLISGINYFLRPNQIVVFNATKVDEKFHARFSAISRSYIYLIVNRRVPLVLTRSRAWLVPEKLDLSAMNEAAQILVGKHDFSSFRNSHCQSKSPVKNIEAIEITSNNFLLPLSKNSGNNSNGGIIQLYIKAPSFLHNQVRIIVGSLRKIGNGSWNKSNLEEILLLRDRKKAGPTAPAHGLYLYEVLYPSDK